MRFPAGGFYAFSQQFLPGLVKLGHEGGHVDGALHNRLVLLVIGFDDRVERQRDRLGQRLFAVEPLGLARGHVDLQGERVDHQGGWPALHGLSAMFKDLFQVAGELKGQGVQAMLRLRSKCGHGRVHGWIVQRRGRFLQPGQQFMHSDGVEGLVAGQRDRTLEGRRRRVQHMVLRF